MAGLARLPTEAPLWASAALRKQVTGEAVTKAIKGALTLDLFRVGFKDRNFRRRH